MSEKRDSNPRPRPWQGRALPTELFSQFSLLANPLASLSCPVFVVCVAKVGIIFELANLLAKKIPFALNFPLFFLFRLPLQPPQPRFHPPHPKPSRATCHHPSPLQARPSGATTRTPTPPPTRCADAPHADKHSHAAPRLHPPTRPTLHTLYTCHLCRVRSNHHPAISTSLPFRQPRRGGPVLIRVRSVSAARGAARG